MTSPPGSSSGPGQQFLAAVKERNFSAAQGHARSLVSSQWKDEYLLPVACVLIVFIVRYWLSSGMRKVQRVCDAAEAKAKEESAALRESVRDMTTRWQRGIKSREQSIQSIFDKNSEMTRTIDGLAAALKSCAPRAFSAAQLN